MVKDSIIPNHMDVYWHDYTGHVKDRPITGTSVPVKAALIGRVGLMLLSCGTGAWRVRNSMNALAEQLGVTLRHQTVVDRVALSLAQENLPIYLDVSA